MKKILEFIFSLFKKKESKVIVNVSKEKKNKTQRDNKILPFDTCNCTSMINALTDLNIDFPKGEYEQPEDNLAVFILNDSEIDNLYKSEHSAEYKDYKNKVKGYYNPFEWHKYLALGTNKWLGKNIVTFKENVSVSELITNLDNGKPVVISGKFKYTKSDGTESYYNHIVTLVGYEKENDKITNFILDDSYGKTGEYTTKKTAEDGDNVYMSYDNFMTQVKPIDSELKWGHLFNC